ncbi:TIM barrel protein [Persicobacter diffluens]|uniref:Xylose isomerase-like TIM barrel domain-containing protein n=1 Tax=Persicobacter diffluens TaxID=981 RepID=A0AAN4W2S7_9BACT|nr:hypothetical protein PEDI_46090 [Persicobacter diffluens]
MKRVNLIILLFLLPIMTMAQRFQADWPMYVYNFGGLNKLPVKEQKALLKKYGYQGVALMANNRKQMIDLSPYFDQADADFPIQAVFFRYNHHDPELVREGWKQVVDQVSGTSTAFWFIIGRDVMMPHEETLALLERVADYCQEKNVVMTIYPHSDDNIPTAEEALTYIEEMDRPNVNMVIHSCHEIRSGNGERLPEIIKKAKDHLAYVTIAGSDRQVDRSTPMTLENSTIMALYRGNFDLYPMLKALKEIEYKGAVGFINHQIKEAPDQYLEGSMVQYQSWLKQLNAPPAEAYDAPDQVLWHAKTKQWFVSNLGGGISLDRDGYSWISRLDASGKVIDPVWIGFEEGFDAISGMISDDQYLYAVDRDGVRQIDIAQRKQVAFYPIPEGEFLNDIVLAKNGDLYVSDFFGDQIFRIIPKKKKVKLFLKTERLEAPDGLYMEDGYLVVASWGKLIPGKGFDTSKKGDLLRVDLKKKTIEPLSDKLIELGNLEGITKGNGNYYITDWASGEVIKVDKDFNPSILIKGLSHPTDPDFSTEQQRLAFPQHGTNQVLFVDVEEKKAVRQ